MLFRFSLLGVAMALGGTCILAQGPYGLFVGALDVRLDPDGRNVTPRALRLHRRHRQKVAGAEGETVNGASIPQPLWSLVGSPWTGKYREASVIHDYYCDVRIEPWPAVHRMFYYAMLANGVTFRRGRMTLAPSRGFWLRIPPPVPHDRHGLPEFLVGDVEISLGLLEIRVPEHQLNRPDVHAFREQVASALMAEVVPVQVDVAERLPVHALPVCLALSVVSVRHEHQ